MMEFGMKRVMASVRVVAVMKKLYNGAPIPVAALCRETDLSPSYLEQIFAKLRAAKIVTGQRGPGGGYHLSAPDSEISVATVIRSVTHIPANSGFEPVLDALDSVLVSQLANGKISTP
jgi:Rrf2 family iron-sulfur cluster assembly transcriptional regulator